MITRIALAILATTCFEMAVAAGDGDLWVGMAAMVCLEQDASYKETPTGGALIKEAGYQHWRATQSATVLSCIAGKRLLPADLCTEILQRDPNGKSGDLNTLYEKYAASIQSLVQINECAKKN